MVTKDPTVDKNGTLSIYVATALLYLVFINDQIAVKSIKPSEGNCMYLGLF